MANLEIGTRIKVDVTNYKTLSPVQQGQMAIFATRGFGEEYTTAEDLLTQIGEGLIEEGKVEFWHILDADQPGVVLYDFWKYWDDIAIIFFAGTTDDTGIALNYTQFEVARPHAKAENLAEEMQKAWDKFYA